MKLVVHELRGCTPTPLGSYLKAFGILRIVAEQVDEEARGWWKNDVFHLATRLSRMELERFFLEDYRPAPLLAPWNAGSGFYYDNDPGLAPIEASTAPRFELYRRAIAVARSASTEMAAADATVRAVKERGKGDRKLREDDAWNRELSTAEMRRKAVKDALVPECRKQWRGDLLRWLDAAIVIDGAGEAMYPALLGSGGNDGRLDFTNNFMQRLGELFDLASKTAAPRLLARSLLPHALWNEKRAGLVDAAIGQYMPGNAGGANASAGFDGSARIDPWDFVFMLEGAVLFSSTVTRRADVDEPPLASAPFAIRASAVGYASAAVQEEGARGEQWMPLWSAPATAGEIGSLIAEGRVRTGARSVQRPLEFAQALARLGVARGIDEFVRFGFIERNGRSNFAVPIGRFSVRAQPQMDLLEDVATWVETLGRAARDEHPPAALVSIARRVESAMLACTQGAPGSGSTGRWQALLVALGEAERQLARSPRWTAEKRLRPLPTLREGWLAAVDDGSTEASLAFALAMAHRPDRPGDGLRRHCLPLDERGAHFSSSGGKDARIRAGAEVVAPGLPVTDALLAILRRRAVEHARDRSSYGLVAPPTACASLDDIAAFVRGDVDDARILALALPLMALARSAARASRRAHAAPHPSVKTHDPVTLAPFALLRACHVPDRAPSAAVGITVARDPAVLRRLDAGDLPAAIALAVSRLRASRIVPRLRHAVGTPSLARRLGAALAFPLSAASDARLVTFIGRIEHDSSDTAITTVQGEPTP